MNRVLCLIAVLNQPLGQGLSLLKTLIYLESVITAQTVKCAFAFDIFHSTVRQLILVGSVFNGGNLAAMISHHAELVCPTSRASEFEKSYLVALIYVLLFVLWPINILAVLVHPHYYAVLIIVFLKITILNLPIGNLEIAVSARIDNFSITAYFFGIVIPRNMAIFRNSLNLHGEPKICDPMFQVMSATFWTGEY